MYIFYKLQNDIKNPTKTKFIRLELNQKLTHKVYVS